MKNQYCNRKSIFFILIICCVFICCKTAKTSNSLSFYPANNQQKISPDTHLKITFKSKPIIGNKGKISVFEVTTNKLVDEIDMSIPAGPTKADINPEASYTQIPYKYTSGNFTNANTKAGTPSGTAMPNDKPYQLTIIGGFTDAFHFYPIIVHQNTATIYLHHNLLEYNKSYYVLVDSTVINTADNTFSGIQDKKTWRFTTRSNAPILSKKTFIVDQNGKGDFNTLQGAIDFIPDNYQETITILIKNGLYEELIYFRNKSNIIIKGENREKTIVQYANNEVFNPHPWNVKTNELAGTFLSRRAAFAIDNCTNIKLLNLTVKTLLKGQAEGLLINGNKIVVKEVNIVGSGDALQTNGTAYFEDIKIDGGGDMILSRGAAFFKNCDFYSPGPFMWVRNTKENHGNVFVNCNFTASNSAGAELGRSPNNKGAIYPYSEAVLINCRLQNIVPKGWGAVHENTKNLRYWEYNSTDSEGKAIDVSQRTSFSRQLTLEKHKELIEDYSNPSFVLGGWNPE